MTSNSLNALEWRPIDKAAKGGQLVRVKIKLWRNDPGDYYIRNFKAFWDKIYCEFKSPLGEVFSCSPYVILLWRPLAEAKKGGGE